MHDSVCNCSETARLSHCINCACVPFRLIDVCLLYFVCYGVVCTFRHIYTFDVIPRATVVAKHCKVLSKNCHLTMRTKVFRDQVKEVNGPTDHMD